MAAKGTKKRKCENGCDKGKVRDSTGKLVNCTACQGRGGIDLSEI